ncbi:MAG: bifunctional class I SAM-dependent methyltransferase/glycosyltransferase family 2 protein [Magnetococcus sp. THC-1_WYH]
MTRHAQITRTRDQTIRSHYDPLAAQREDWIQRNRFFHEDDLRTMRFLIPEGKRVLDLGCGSGRLLAELKPSYGVGVDISPAMIAVARENHPHLHFVEGNLEDPEILGQWSEPFDFIILVDTVGMLHDCTEVFTRLRSLCTSDTRLVVSHYNWIWEPVLRAGEKLGLKMPSLQENWLSMAEIGALLEFSDYQVVRHERRQLLPIRLFGLGFLVNLLLAPLPVFRRLCVRYYLVARPVGLESPEDRTPSATVVIPCRNEKGNIEAAIQRMPRLCADMEILFVEGHSQDGTLEEIHRVMKAYPQWDISVLVQDGQGKADAVYKGFDHARGDVLIILDADLTVPPEELPKFYHAIASNKGDFIIGTRLVYAMEGEAMRPLNRIANALFSILFTWILNQRYTDTLCGTKVLRRRHYQIIKANRHYFGDFDPFGDFDLIFGAIKGHLKMVEIPIHYASRAYGETQISRFRHGILLFRMLFYAYRKIKALV